MKTKHELNAPAIKKALKNSFVNVISCYKGKGTTKKATYITIDYKDIKRLESFITERGKISSTRANGNCAKHQRRVVGVIKKARFVSLLPYVR